jgi:hypothetical protein
MKLLQRALGIQWARDRYQDTPIIAEDNERVKERWRVKVTALPDDPFRACARTALRGGKSIGWRVRKKGCLENNSRRATPR